MANLPKVALIDDLEYALNKHIIYKNKLKECFDRYKSKTRIPSKRRGSLEDPAKKDEYNFDLLYNDKMMDENELEMLREYQTFEYSFVKEYKVDEEADQLPKGQEEVGTKKAK